MLSVSGGGGANQNAALGFVYARYVTGPLHLGAVVSYGSGDIDGTRALPGTGLSATGDRDGSFVVMQTQAAYDIPIGAYTLQPRATFAYLSAEQNGFSESGASILDLTYGATSTDAIQTRLSARVMRNYGFGTWSVEPWAEAGVQEQWTGLNRTVSVVDGAYGAAVPGVSTAPTSALVGLGVEASSPQGLDVYIRYDGQIAANSIGTAFTAGVGMKF
jgi:uncharacterized protein with beta-barrel porin domain